MNTKSLVAAAVIATMIASPALAQRAQQQQQRTTSPNSASDVYVNGQYVGSDPDPNIRAQLQRRQPGGSW
jgi:opacity protein-like surface antigen